MIHKDDLHCLSLEELESYFGEFAQCEWEKIEFREKPRLEQAIQQTLRPLLGKKIDESTVRFAQVLIDEAIQKLDLRDLQVRLFRNNLDIDLQVTCKTYPLDLISKQPSVIKKEISNAYTKRSTQQSNPPLGYAGIDRSTFQGSTWGQD